MSAILGITLAAVLFGLATRLRARDRGGCTGGCVGCTGDGRCERTDEATNAVTHGAKS
jgi:hypothetical protein